MGRTSMVETLRNETYVHVEKFRNSDTQKQATKIPTHMCHNFFLESQSRKAESYQSDYVQKQN
jgi:hypothetical protein